MFEAPFTDITMTEHALQSKQYLICMMIDPDNVIGSEY